MSYYGIGEVVSLLLNPTTLINIIACYMSNREISRGNT